MKSGAFPIFRSRRIDIRLRPKKSKNLHDLIDLMVRMIYYKKEPAEGQVLFLCRILVRRAELGRGTIIFALEAIGKIALG